MCDNLVNKISEESILEFKQARGNAQAVRKVCCRYFKRGIQEGLSQEELIDYLGISSPSILYLAGYSEEEELDLMELIGEISDFEIESV